MHVEIGIVRVVPYDVQDTVKRAPVLLQGRADLRPALMEVDHKSVLSNAARS